MKKVVFLLIAVFIFTSCLDDIKSKFSPEKNVSFETVKIENRYRLKIPKYMKETTELNDDASLQYMNTFKEAYVIVIDEPKDSFVTLFKDIDEYIDSISVLENYKKVQTESFESFVTGFKVYNEEKQKINGLNAITLNVDGAVEDFDVTYTYGFFEGKETLYMMLCWTEQSSKNKYKPTYKTMLESFSEVR